MVRAKEVAASAAEPGRHLGLSNKALQDMYYRMVLSRLLGDRMFILNRQGRAAFAIGCQGHEACQVGSATALRAGKDWVLPYYRDIGVVLTVGMTPREIMLHFMAKAEDPNSGGRQMPNHWGNLDLRIVSGSSPVATQSLHAVGVALASKMRGERDVTVTYLGEGSTSQGDFHEAMNFAAVQKLPVIFFVENNGYAISEPIWKEMSIPNVADRAKGYGFEGITMDGNDLITVFQTMKWAVEEVRRGHGPKLIEAKTYRITPHSSDDDDRRYRSRKELQEWMAKDPLDRAKKFLLEEGILTEARDAALRERAAAEVQDAVEYADRAAYPEPESALRHVFFEGGA